MKCFKKVAAVLCFVGFVVVLAGCNTVKGAGEDISAGGNAIVRAAG